VAKQLSEAQKVLRREKRRLWREENRDEYRAQQRESYRRRKDKLAELRASPEARAAKRDYDAGYRESNAVEISQRKQRYYREHREQVIERVRRNRRAKKEVRDGGFDNEGAQ